MSNSQPSGTNSSFLYNPSSFRSFSSISPRNKRIDGSDVKGDSDTVPITIKDSAVTSSFRSSNYTSLYGSKSGSVDKPVTSSFSTFKYTSLQDKITPKTRSNEQTNGLTSETTSIQNKRELFFRNESTPSTVSNGPAVVPVTSSVSNHVPAPTPASVPLVTTTKETFINKDPKLDYLKSREQSIDDKLKEKEKVVPKKTRTIEGYVGFASLPNQVYRRAVKKGFEFNLMVVGESGLGKSTLINSMFLSDIYSVQHPGPSFRIKKTVQVETIKVLLKENGVNLTLTVVDTPGFGDAVDNSNCWQPIIDYIENKYEEYLNGESRVNRKSVLDGRVHCCLYFIAPSGHGLKPLDVEFMKKLHDKINIIPLLSKADTMTPDECTSFKKQIMSEIQQHKIKIYEFPDCLDEEENKMMKPLRHRVPFAVVGSNTVLEVDGKKVRGRKYPWGIVDVENMDHCDFIPLRNILVRTHMQDLKDVTSNVHYENYRCRKLAGVSSDKSGKINNKNPLAQMEEEKKEHELTMKKMEKEMEQVFEMKVKEKQQKLKDSESELQKHHEQMKSSLEAQERELHQRREQFEREVRKWEESNNVSVEELRRKHLEAVSKDSVDGKDKNKKKKGLF